MNGAKEKPRESLWSVSAARLPYYLVVYAVIVGVVTVMAMAAATGTLREAIFSAAPRIAAAGAAAVTILTCLEGLVMGARNCCSNGLGPKAGSRAGRKSPTAGRPGTKRTRPGSPCPRRRLTRSTTGRTDLADFRKRLLHR